MAGSSCCRPQISPTWPRRDIYKTLARQPFPRIYANTWAPKRSLGRQERSGTWIAAARLEDPPARSPGITFPRAAWESAARRPLAVPSAPGAAAESRQQEKGLPSPAPGRQAPPPGARPHPREPDPAPPRSATTAQSHAGPGDLSACCDDEAAAAAPAAATALLAAAADVSHRLRCPKLGRATPTPCN